MILKAFGVHTYIRSFFQDISTSWLNLCYSKCKEWSTFIGFFKADSQTRSILFLWHHLYDLGRGAKGPTRIKSSSSKALFGRIIQNGMYLRNGTITITAWLCYYEHCSIQVGRYSIYFGWSVNGTRSAPKATWKSWFANVGVSRVKKTLMSSLFLTIDINFEVLLSIFHTVAVICEFDKHMENKVYRHKTQIVRG